jgi:RNA-directed DNA polymerase
MVGSEGAGADLNNNLFIWNRMSPVSYLPASVMAVEIPQPHGGGTVCSGATRRGRIAQTVVAADCSCAA